MHLGHMIALAGSGAVPGGGDVTAPTVQSATILAAAPFFVEVQCDEVVTLTDETGFSVTGLNPPTIVGVQSIDDFDPGDFAEEDFATGTIFYIELDRPALGHETWTFEWDGTNNVEDAAGNALEPDTEAIALSGTFPWDVLDGAVAAYGGFAIDYALSVVTSAPDIDSVTPSAVDTVAPGSFVQATVSGKPHKVQVGKLWVADFDGTLHRLQSDAAAAQFNFIHLAAGCTVFQLGYVRAHGSSYVGRSWDSGGTDGAGTQGGYFSINHNTGLVDMQVKANNAVVVRVLHAATAALLDSWHTICGRWDGTNGGFVDVDGGTPTVDATVDTTPSTADCLAPMFLGCNRLTGQFYDGQIAAHLFLIGNAVGGGDMTAIRAALNAIRAVAEDV